MPPPDLSRREFLGAAAFAAALATPYTPPDSPRATLNLNLDWKFLRDDVPDAEAASFDDSKWATVSVPHTFNDVDSFRELISHGGSLTELFLTFGVMGWPVAFQDQLWNDEDERRRLSHDNAHLRHRYRKDRFSPGWPEQGRPHHCQKAL
jgi:hypothetical protein